MTEPRKERDGDIDGRPDVDGIWAFKARDMNRVSKTWFSGRRHVEKTPHQTWSEHENRVYDARFISPKSSFRNSRC